MIFHHKKCCEHKFAQRLSSSTISSIGCIESQMTIQNVHDFSAKEPRERTHFDRGHGQMILHSVERHLIARSLASYHRLGQETQLQ